MPTYAISGGISRTPALGATFTLADVPRSDAEGRYRATGHRPSLPLLVSAVNALAEPAGLPDNGSYCLSAGFVPVAATPLYAAGAAGGSVVTKVVRAGLPTVVAARDPAYGEVVWLSPPAGTPDGGLWRWDGAAWRAWDSMPERALAGVRVFDALDPDRVYAFWARLLGGAQAALADDAVSLGDLFDADRCPADYLGALAYQFGVAVDAADPAWLSRERLRSGVARNQTRGTAAGVASRLALMGYAGYSQDVWVNPVAAGNWYDYAHAPGGDQTIIDANGWTVDPNSGQKGDDWVESPHGTDPGAPYVPSSRVSVHLNNRDGTPLSAALPAATVTALKRAVAAALGRDVLPANASVRFFATDTAPGVFRYL